MGNCWTLPAEPKDISISYANGVLEVIRMAIRDGEYIYTIPTEHMDLSAISELKQEFENLGISYGMNNIYPAFRSKEELNRALLRVYNESSWVDKWRIKEYLMREGLLKAPDCEGVSCPRYDPECKFLHNGKCYSPL